MSALSHFSTVYGILAANLDEAPASVAGDHTPLLLHPSTDRAAQKARTQALLSRDAMALGEIYVVQTKLDDLRNKIRVAHARLQYSLSPLSSLPDELITLILELAASEDDLESQFLIDWMTSIRISHVCSVWRQISLGMPSLWMYLTVASWQQRQLLDVFLERLGDQRMHLEVIGNKRREHGYEIPAFDISPTPAFLERLRWVRLVDEDMDPCFPLVSCDQVPSSLVTIEYSNPKVRIDKHLENLESLRFEDGHLGHNNHHLSFHLLRDLQFGFVGCEEMSLFWHVSAEMPCLELLKLSWVGEGDHELWQVEGGWTDWQIQHPFPMLDELVVDNCCFAVWSSLRAPDMPKLRKLSLTPHWSWDRDAVTTHLANFLSRHVAPLESLHLAFYYDNVAGIFGLLSMDHELPTLSPNLKHLSIRHHREPSGGEHSEEASPAAPLVFKSALQYLMRPTQADHLVIELAEEFVGDLESWSSPEAFKVIPPGDDEDED